MSTARTSRLVLYIAALTSVGQASAQSPDSPPIRDPQRLAGREVVSWVDMKKQHVVMQEFDYSCGAAALATVQRYYWGYDVTEQNVLTITQNMLNKADPTGKELADRIKNGLSLTDLQKTAEIMKFQAVIGTLSFRELTASKVPVIVAIKTNDYDHFVVVRGVFDGYVYLADPMRGKLRVDGNDFQQQWIKNAVLVVAPPGKTQSDRPYLNVKQGEVDFPMLNRQYIRTRPEKSFLVK